MTGPPLFTASFPKNMHAQLARQPKPKFNPHPTSTDQDYMILLLYLPNIIWWQQMAFIFLKKNFYHLMLFNTLH